MLLAGKKLHLHNCSCSSRLKTHLSAISADDCSFSEEAAPMAETAEKTADSAPKEKLPPAEAAPAPVVEEEDFFEDFPLEEGARCLKALRFHQTNPFAAA